MLDSNTQIVNFLPPVRCRSRDHKSHRRTRGVRKRMSGIFDNGERRIVRTVDEPGRFGFAYSTLPGHPEEGEEAFLIETDDTGTVAFNVEAISRPAALVAKLGAPVSRMVQRRTATRYLEGLAHYVNAHS